MWIYNQTMQNKLHITDKLREGANGLSRVEPYQKFYIWSIIEIKATNCMQSLSYSLSTRKKQG